MKGLTESVAIVLLIYVFHWNAYWTKSCCASVKIPSSKVLTTRLTAQGALERLLVHFMTAWLSEIQPGQGVSSDVLNSRIH